MGPTTDQARDWEGALLFLGGSKGFGIGLVVEILSGILMASPVGPHIPRPFESKEFQNLRCFLAALDIRRFLDPAAFRDRMDTLEGLWL